MRRELILVSLGHQAISMAQRSKTLHITLQNSYTTRDETINATLFEALRGPGSPRPLDGQNRVFYFS